MERPEFTQKADVRTIQPSTFTVRSRGLRALQSLASLSRRLVGQSEQELTQKAAKAGEAAGTTGNLQLMAGDGRVATAYNENAIQSSVDTRSRKTQVALMELAQKFPTDPDAYDTASNELVRQGTEELAEFSIPQAEQFAQRMEIHRQSDLGPIRNARFAIDRDVAQQEQRAELNAGGDMIRHIVSGMPDNPAASLLSLGATLRDFIKTSERTDTRGNLLANPVPIQEAMIDEAYFSLAASTIAHSEDPLAMFESLVDPNNKSLVQLDPRQEGFGQEQLSLTQVIGDPATINQLRTVARRVASEQRRERTLEEVLRAKKAILDFREGTKDIAAAGTSSHTAVTAQSLLDMDISTDTVANLMIEREQAIRTHDQMVTVNEMSIPDSLSYLQSEEFNALPSEVQGSVAEQTIVRNKRLLDSTADFYFNEFPQEKDAFQAALEAGDTNTIQNTLHDIQDFGVQMGVPDLATMPFPRSFMTGIANSLNDLTLMSPKDRIESLRSSVGLVGEFGGHMVQTLTAEVSDGGFGVPSTYAFLATATGSNSDVDATIGNLDTPIDDIRKSSNVTSSELTSVVQPEVQKMMHEVSMAVPPVNAQMLTAIGNLVTRTALHRHASGQSRVFIGSDLKQAVSDAFDKVISTRYHWFPNTQLGPTLVPNDAPVDPTKIEKAFTKNGLNAAIEGLGGLNLVVDSVASQVDSEFVQEQYRKALRSHSPGFVLSPDGTGMNIMNIDRTPVRFIDDTGKDQVVVVTWAQLTQFQESLTSTNAEDIAPMVAF